MKPFFISLFTLLLALNGLQAQQKLPLTDLTVEKIMREPAEWVGTAPSDISWSRDGKSIYFLWNPDADRFSTVHKIGIEGGTPVADDDRFEGFPEDYVYNQSKSKMLFERKGDIYLLDVKSKKETRITATQASETNPRFHSDEDIITFTTNDNLFSVHTKTGLVTQLTNIIIEEEEEKEERSRSRQGNRVQDSWLRKDQVVTSEYLKDRRNRPRRQSQAALRYLENMEEQMEEIELPNVRDLQLSSDGKYVSFMIFRAAKNPAKRTVVPNYVSSTGYTTDLPTRPKVGGDRPFSEIGIYNIAADSFYILDATQLPGIDDLPDYVKDYPDKSFEKKPRKVSANGMYWSPSKDYAVVHFASIDNKDRWIMRLIPASGDLIPIDRQRDEAWIAGPGIGSEFRPGVLDFMPDGEHIYFQSEKTGYSHLYTHNLTTGQTKQLTKGQYEVYSPFLSSDAKTWYFTANIKHPGIRHFYSMPAKGGKPRQITTVDGNNQVSLSPDEKQLAIRYSYMKKPWELYVRPISRVQP